MAMTLCKLLVLRQWGEKKNNHLIKLKSEKATSLCLKFIIITYLYTYNYLLTNLQKFNTHKKTLKKTRLSQEVFMLLLNKIQCPFMTSNLTIELGIAVNFFTKGRILNKAKFEKIKKI